jgi:iron complex outermembrane receptor protein
VTGIYQSAARKVDANDLSAIQPAWGKLDARIAIGAPDGKWEIALVGRNLTNKLTLAYGGAGGLTSVVFAPDARNVVVDPPRAVLITASTKF